jgi:cytochrome P450
VKRFLDPTWQEGKTFVMSALRSVGFGSGKASEEKILEQIELLMEKLDQKAKVSEPVDTYPLMMLTASNVIQNLLFATSYNLDDPELERRTKAVKRWYTVFKDTTYFEYFPLWMVSFLFPKRVKDLKDATNDIKDFIKFEVLEHQKTLNPDQPRDFVDIYLSKKGETVDINQLVETTFMFLPDSVDTLAALLSWVILYVTHHPDVMRKIQKEVNDVTSGNRHVNWSDRPNLTYTESTIMEAIRVSSAVTVTPLHTPIADCYYQGYFIPAGTQMLGNLYAGLMDPDVFEKPEVFDPTRFLSDNGKLQKIDTWIPFSVGEKIL